MNALSVFRMPEPVKITGRTSTITNSFVNAIIPCIPPDEAEVREALRILGLSVDDVRCVYCGDRFTEWDHLRPLVRNKRPTGFISEIANLVPACGRCNQSKGAHPWRSWMVGKARLCPTARGIADLGQRMQRLEDFERWKQPTMINFVEIVGEGLWEKHWANHHDLLQRMSLCQETADDIRKMIAKRSLTATA